jgi:hypothetical protein
MYIVLIVLQKMAGVAGLEPAVTGSKPVALPLGYTPKKHIEQTESIQKTDLSNSFLTYELTLIKPEFSI